MLGFALGFAGLIKRKQIFENTLNREYSRVVSFDIAMLAERCNIRSQSRACSQSRAW